MARPHVVLLFAGLRDRAGSSEVTITLADGATVRDVREALEAQFAVLGSLEHCRIAVAQAFASDDDPVAPGAELALIPPVSGGQDEFPGSHSVLSHADLSLSRVVDAVTHEDAGGVCTFTGNVRRHSRGKTVVHLDYEAYPAMAVAQMDAIASTIMREIEGARVCIHHRVGRLTIGEAAVIIAASAPHRAEAFDACRRAIEALKQDVPIWKREVDAEGGTWIGQGP